MRNKASSFLPRIQPGVEEPWVDNRVPGAVGAITDWINAQSLRPFPIFALGAAIVVVGTIIGRKVRGPQGGPTHLYMIGLLPTGWGKDGPLGGALRLLTAFDESLIGPDQFVSSQGVYRQLIAQPLCCCIVDELGEQIELLNDQSGNGFVTMVFSTLKIAYNGWKDVRTAATAHSDSKIIRCPAPSILGAGTPEEFFRALKAKDLKGGFVNRLLVLPFEGHRKPPEKIRTATVEPPQALLDRLRALPRLGVLESSLDKKLPAPMDIPWADDGAADVYFAFSRKMDALQEHGEPNRRDLCQRCPENAERIAINVAVGRGARAIWKPDISFAIDFVERSFEAVVGGVEKYMYERFEFPRFCEAALNKIGPVGSVKPIRDLKRAFRNNLVWGTELDRVFAHLRAEERIKYVENVGTSNNPSPGYRRLKD